MHGDPGHRRSALAAVLLSCGALVAVAVMLSGDVEGPIRPEPVAEPPTALVEYGDAHFDEETGLLEVPFRNPGYHSRVPSGVAVHPTRESLAYAVVLLDRGEPGDVERAVGILRTVLPLQDDDPASPTFGVWPWLLEEPLAEMASPDLNWADFCAAHLLQILHDHDDALPDDLVSEVEAAVRRAAVAIRRRDVGPAYTNVAVLGGGVCAAAGERLRDASLLRYGRRRLQRVVEFTEDRGGFVEYNSPPYLQVVVAACERTLHLARDHGTRRAAEWLRRRAWQSIAGHFHPGTQQWAGPHARTSRDRLRISSTRFLSSRTGVDVATHPTMTDEPPRELEAARPLRCPPEFVDRFRRSTPGERTTRTTFVRARDARNTRIGTTWFSEDACLGSVNRSSFWTQRKPVIGSWRTERDPAVVLRVRCLADGRDFASAGLVTTQRGPRVLGLLQLRRGRGRWHPSQDRPPSGEFVLDDLRLRVELRGVGATAGRLGEDRLELRAGSRRVVVHALAGRFDGRPVRWELGQEGNHVFVDGVCIDERPRRLRFDGSTECSVGFALELLDRNRPAADRSPSPLVVEKGVVSTSWNTGRGGRTTLTTRMID